MTSMSKTQTIHMEDMLGNGYMTVLLNNHKTVQLEI